MGSRTISQCSYDERMKALLRVSVHWKRGHAFYGVADLVLPPIRNVVETPNEKRIHLVSSEEQEEKRPLSDQKSENYPNAEQRLLRQRSRPNSVAESEWVQDENLNDAADRDEYEMNEKRPIKTKSKQKGVTSIGDPLHWFGLLVSPSLRDSQQQFKKGRVFICDYGEDMSFSY